MAASDSAAGSFGSLPAAGNFILVLVGAWTSGGTTWAAGNVTDNQGNTYTRAVTQNDAGGDQATAIYYAENIGTPSGTFTVTCDPDGGAAQYIVGSAIEFSGVQTSGSLDRTASNQGNSTAISSGATAATQQADELIAGVCAIDATQASLTVQVTSPVWTEEHEELSISWEPGEGDSKIVSSAAAYTAAWTAATGNVWTACIATFLAAAGGGGGALVPSQNRWMWY